MRKCESGITLVSLVVTIIVILILSTVAISSGKEALENTRLTTFTAQMKIMQIQVNNLYDKYKNNGSVTVDDKTYKGQGNENENDLGIDEIGTEVTSADYQDILESLNISNLEGYRFYSSDLLKKLGIEGVEGTYLVNVPDRKVISVEGLKYRGKMYYSLEQLPDTLYNVEYDDANDDLGIPTIGNVKIEANDADTWRVEVEGIEYSNYVEKGTVKYGKKEIKEDGSESVVNTWNSAQGTEFIVSEPGIYSVKVVDAAGRESGTKDFYAYAKNGLVLYYDGINNTGTGTYDASATTWKDLSGNGNDATLNNINFSSDEGEKGLKFIGDLAQYAISEDDVFTEEPEAYTVEIVAKSVGDKKTYEWLWSFRENSSPADGISMFIYSKGDGYIYHQYQPIEESSGSAAASMKLSTFNNCIFSRSTMLEMISNSSEEGAISIYENGVEYNEMQCFGGLIKNKKIALGGTMWNSEVSFNGNIYSVRVYNRALSDEEIKSNYAIDKELYEIDSVSYSGPKIVKISSQHEANEINYTWEELEMLSDIIKKTEKYIASTNTELIITMEDENEEEKVYTIGINDTAKVIYEGIEQTVRIIGFNQEEGKGISFAFEN